MRMSHRAEIGRRRSAAGPLGAAVVVMISAFAGCSGGESVTPEAIAAARKAWNDAGIRDYDLEWTSSGVSQAHYFVTVRGGVVRKVELVRSPAGSGAWNATAQACGRINRIIRTARRGGA